jgi:hypothetical protein
MRRVVIYGRAPQEATAPVRRAASGLPLWKDRRGGEIAAAGER